MWLNTNEVNVWSNNPDDFKVPFELFGDYEKEIYEWKYFRLNNRPKNPWSMRCNSIVYGGYVPQNHLH